MLYILRLTSVRLYSSRGACDKKWDNTVTKVQQYWSHRQVWPWRHDMKWTKLTKRPYLWFLSKIILFHAVTELCHMVWSFTERDLDRGASHHFPRASREDTSLGNHLQHTSFPRTLVPHHYHLEEIGTFSVILDTVKLTTICQPLNLVQFQLLNLSMLTTAKIPYYCCNIRWVLMESKISPKMTAWRLLESDLSS